MLEFAGINIPFNRLKGISLGNPATEKWPVIQAEGYGETFMVAEGETLRWFTGWALFGLYGYKAADIQKVPLSWFYGKTIGASVPYEGKTIPKESIPNYAMYLKATQTTAPVPYKCPICGATFSSPAEVRDHVASAHAPAPTPLPRPSAPTIRQQECARCGSLLEITSQALAPEYQKEVICPVCGYNFGFKAVDSKILERKPWPPVAAPPLPEGKLPVPPYVSPEIAERVDQKLDTWEEQVEGLEQSFRGMKTSESKAIGQQWGILAETATKLLTTLQAEKTRTAPMLGLLPYPGYYLTWTLAQKMRIENLIGRLMTLIQNCRVEAQRGPSPWPQLPTDILIDYPEVAPLPGLAPWPPEAPTLTTTTRLFQQSFPWDVAIRGPSAKPEITVINGPAEQRMLEPIGQEPWELAEVAVTPAPPKKITPYLILAGLVVTTLAVWSYKKKKKREVKAKK